MLGYSSKILYLKLCLERQKYSCTAELFLLKIDQTGTFNSSNVGYNGTFSSKHIQRSEVII